MAGATAERQEEGLVKAVTSAVRSNKGSPITIVVGKTKISGIVSANKYTGRQDGGSEPYTDVELHTNTKKIINLSCKGKSAPSLAGGGLTGLELAVPGLSSKFMKLVHTTLSKKIKPGDKVPDVYGEILGSNKETIVVGNKKMGGPIDYMYIGKMDVTSKYNKETNELTIDDTELTPAKKYASSHTLYFRLRARREDQRFDPLAKDNKGTPKIYGKSPSKGDSAGRIVIQDVVPAGSVIVKL